MKNEHNKNLDRRDFLKVLGGAAAVTSATLLPGCKNKQESAYTATTDIPTDQMTYRINPSTQDRVSLLGYGCIRWPTVSNNSARDSSDDIDQETVNKLVDVAIAHGVNYFDTSPAYCKGRSERATGIALSRYPRDKYFIATKLSNFVPSTWSREASIAMYHNSFKELQVHRLFVAAWRRHGERITRVQRPLHRQRGPRFPPRRTTSRTNTEPRIFLPRRHQGIRLSSFPPR